MPIQSIISVLKKNKSSLYKKGVKHLWLFGSQAEGNATLGSDIDLMFERGDQKMTLVTLSGLNIFLESILNAKIDLSEKKMLIPGIRNYVEAQSIKIF